MISLTKAASDRIKSNLAKRPKGLGIRVGVKPTGCSGLAYMLEYVDAPYGPGNDISFVNQGIHIFVDPKSLVYLENIEMDWVKKGLNEGFEIQNPQEKDRCGCGESFRVE